MISNDFLIQFVFIRPILPILQIIRQVLTTPLPLCITVLPHVNSAPLTCNLTAAISRMPDRRLMAGDIIVSARGNCPVHDVIYD